MLTCLLQCSDHGKPVVIIGEVAQSFAQQERRQGPQQGPQHSQQSAGTAHFVQHLYQALPLKCTITCGHAKTAHDRGPSDPMSDQLSWLDVAILEILIQARSQHQMLTFNWAQL